MRLSLPWLAVLGVAAAYVVRKGYQLIFSTDFVGACSTEYAAHNHGGPRTQPIDWIVVHDTEGETALSAARWFVQPLAIGDGGPGSTQVVVGEDGCYRTLPDDVVPYGAGFHANARGLHVELSGHSTYSRDQWMSRATTLRRAAAWLASWSRDYGVPLRYVDAKGLLAGERGVTTHREVSRAWPSDTNHQDPGPNFPMDYLLDLAGGNGASYHV